MCSTSSLGSTQLAERWNTVSWPATLAISGMDCTALAALPITATRLPSSSTDSSHAPVCMATPSKLSRPSMVGYFSSPNMPWPLMTTSATTSSPESVVTTQVPVASSHAADAMPVLRRMWGHRSRSVTVLRMYSRISGWAA